MSDKLMRWLIFGVLAALVPLAFGWFFMRINGQDASLEVILSRGELLLITAALCASGLGELIGSQSDRSSKYKIIFGGCAVIVLLLSSMAFSSIAYASQVSEARDINFIMWASIGIYLCAFLTSGNCVRLSE